MEKPAFGLEKGSVQFPVHCACPGESFGQRDNNREVAEHTNGTDTKTKILVGFFGAMFEADKTESNNMII